MSEITVINNYVDIPEQTRICRHKKDNVIIFLGKMDYEPNITAVKYFADDIFPSLKRAYPNLEFIIVGARPSSEILKLDKRVGIKVTGFVESTEPFFQDATIVIAPMLSGAGVQNKIIQAMAYGCCVATTDIGAEGLCLRGDDLAIFNSTDEWIKGVSTLLSNRDLRIKYGSQARDTINSTLSKEIVYRQFCKMIDGI